MKEHIHVHLDAIRDATDQTMQALLRAETKIQVLETFLQDDPESLKLLNEARAELRAAFDLLTGSSE